MDLLVYDALTEAERSHLPGELAQVWQRKAMKQLQYNEQLCYEQKQILEELRRAKIPCVILKGASCGKNYPNPSLRCAGDIDLLVGTEGIGPVRELLESRGYVAAEEPHPFHLHMRNGWKVVELHHEPAGIPQGEIGTGIRGFFRGSELKAVEHISLPVECATWCMDADKKVADCLLKICFGLATMDRRKIDTDRDCLRMQMRAIDRPVFSKSECKPAESIGLCARSIRFCC